MAAVGVNRGTDAALDSTLVWLVTANDNDISSAVSIGAELDVAEVNLHGGSALDSLINETEYTFWLAERSVYDAGLTESSRTPLTFADTTLTLRYRLLSRSGGDSGFISDLRIIRDQRLTSDKYLIVWSPPDAGARRLAIRRGSSGGYTDLIWDLIAENTNADGIQSPVVIGEPPAGVVIGAEWPDDGFSAATHTLWMTSENWSGSFSPRAPGYAFLQIFSSNFED